MSVTPGMIFNQPATPTNFKISFIPATSTKRIDVRRPVRRVWRPTLYLQTPSPPNPKSPILPLVVGPSAKPIRPDPRMKTKTNIANPKVHTLEICALITTGGPEGPPVSTQ
jgi:hypothetical protein